MTKKYTVVVLGIADDGDMLQGAYNASSFDTESKAHFSVGLGFRCGGHTAFLIDHESGITQVFDRGTENLKSSIREMQGYVDELIYAGFDRRKEIKKYAETCDQLMIYSHEVADINSYLWKERSSLVMRILVATNGDYLLE